MSSAIATWAERRPPRTENERAKIAEQYARHLPKTPTGRFVSNEDLDAMRAAFIRRFDEDLPRTETLMAVASIGYRMALRDSRLKPLVEPNEDLARSRSDESDGSRSEIAQPSSGPPQ